MKSLFILSFCFFVFIIPSFACNDTRQIKIFPIGVSENNIVTVEIEVNRTEFIRAYQRLNLVRKPKEVKNYDITWIFKSYLSVYDLNQNLIYSKVVDSTYSVGMDYIEAIKESHGKVVQLILQEYPSINLFKVKSFSFCDFQKECNSVSVQSDTDSIGQVTSLIYKDEKYDLPRLSNNTAPAVSGYSISSVRLYKAKNIKLAVVHLGGGGFFYWNEQTKREDYIMENKKQKIDYSSVKTFVYQESVCHHGYGLDVFISIEK